MKLRFVPLLLFAFFCLGGGLLYFRGLFGAKLLKGQVGFVNTTVWWWIVLLLWCFGFYLIRFSLSYAYDVRGVGLLGVGALLIFCGYVFIEQFLA